MSEQRILFGASYYPHHYNPESWANDLDLMAEAGVNALRIGDFAWVRFQPTEEHYNFEWFDQFLDLAHQKGIGVLMVPPLRCPPAWLLEKDPSISIINEAGVQLEFGSRYTFCINHPTLRDLGFELTRRIVERYKNHPATLGWHIDNEYGDEPDCHCDRCKTKWHSWLEQRYKSIEALNLQWKMIFWGLEFNHFGQIPTPRLSKTYHHPALLQAWRQFRSDCNVEIVSLHAEVVRRADSSRYVTTNLQSLHNPRTDYFDLQSLDIAGVNYYPPYGEGCRENTLGLAVIRGILERNFQLHELRNGPHMVPGRGHNTPDPGAVERLTMHCIGHGADAIFYFQWRGVPFGPEQSHGTPINYDGSPNRVYHEVKKIGQQLKAVAPLLEGSQVQSEIAVLYDFPTRWSMQGGQEWVGPAALYLDHAKRIYNAIRKLGVNCDATGRGSDWTRYKVLVAPLFNCLNDEIVQRLCDFVAGGGILVWHPLSGTKNTETEIYPSRLHPQLEELFGLSVHDFGTAATDEPIPFVWKDKSYEGRLFCDVLTPNSAQVGGTFTQGWLRDTPALTENRFEEGRAIYLATLADTNFYSDFFANLCREAEVRFLLGEQAPAKIEVVERTAPNGQRYLFVLNATAEPQKLKLGQPMRDVWNQQSVSEEYDFAPWQVRICTP